jgi:hypothetical protein
LHEVAQESLPAFSRLLLPVFSRMLLKLFSYQLQAPVDVRAILIILTLDHIPYIYYFTGLLYFNLLKAAYRRSKLEMPVDLDRLRKETGGRQTE